MQKLLIISVCYYLFCPDEAKKIKNIEPGSHFTKYFLSHGRHMFIFNGLYVRRELLMKR